MLLPQADGAGIDEYQSEASISPGFLLFEQTDGGLSREAPAMSVA
jgi:hypothetical protein